MYLQHLDQDSFTGLLARVLGVPEVRLDSFKPREQLVGLVVLYTVGHNNLVTLFPIHRGSDLVLGRQLQRINDTQQFIDISSRRGRVGNDESNHVRGVNDEDGSDGEGQTEGVDVGLIESIEHIVGSGNLAILVTNNGKLD